MLGEKEQALLHLYILRFEWIIGVILCLCSNQCIRDVMMQRMQVSKGIEEKMFYLTYETNKVLRMGHFKLTLMSCFVYIN